ASLELDEAQLRKRAFTTDVRLKARLGLANVVQACGQRNKLNEPVVKPRAYRERAGLPLHVSQVVDKRHRRTESRRVITLGDGLRATRLILGLGTKRARIETKQARIESSVGVEDAPVRPIHVSKRHDIGSPIADAGTTLLAFKKCLPAIRQCKP